MIEVACFGPILDAHPKHFSEDDVDEIVGRDATVHLEVLSDNVVMLIVADGERHLHAEIYHDGRVPIRVRVVEDQTNEPS